MQVSVTVNGQPQTHDVEPRTLLVQFLREECRLTGTNIGCDTSSCGACTVLVDGEAVNSCLVPLAQVQGTRITTIEGLGGKHPLQRAFVEHGGAQCGICTPGMVIAAVNLLERTPNPDEAQIRDGLAGNLCRCTGYMKIFEAVVKACQMNGGKA